MNSFPAAAPFFRALLALACAVALASFAGAQDGLQIGVRSGIDQAEKDKRDHDLAYAHDPAKRLRLFFLARVSEEKSGYRKLTRPVDANSLAREVTRQLEAQGFRAVQGGQKPELVITVKYGRGQLMSNPYLDRDNLQASDPQKVGQSSNLSNSDTMGPQSHKSYVGLEEKRQRAGFEQLIIQVRAWKYPPPADPKQKEEMLWVTTMHVADPDHTDLNVIAAKMLAAGSPYFDRHIDRGSPVEIDTSLPEGRVKVGMPEEVEPAKPKTN